MATNKNDFDDTLPYPGTSERLAESIGQFVVAWGVLDRELDLSLQVLFHIDATLAGCIWSNLGTKTKLDVISSATSMLEPALGKRITSIAHSIVKQITDMNDRVRNTIAHAKVTAFADEDDPDKTKWELVRFIARKSHSMTIYPGNARYWGAQARTTLALAQRWRSLLAQMHKRTKDFTLDDYDEICGIELKYGETRPINRRKRQPPKIRAWQGRRAKLVKWPRS